MNKLLAVTSGFAMFVTACGSLFVGDPEGPGAAIWATDACAILVPALALSSSDVDGSSLAVAIDDARKALEQVEPTDGAGRLGDRLTDDLESIAGDIEDLAEDGASAVELDAEWARLRRELLVMLRSQASTLPAEASVAFRASCSRVFEEDS